MSPLQRFTGGFSDVPQELELPTPLLDCAPRNALWIYQYTRKMELGNLSYGLLGLCAEVWF